MLQFVIDLIVVLGQAVFAEFFENVELCARGGEAVDLKVKIALALLQILAEALLASLMSTATFLERLELRCRNGGGREKCTFGLELGG